MAVRSYSFDLANIHRGLNEVKGELSEARNDLFSGSGNRDRYAVNHARVVRDYSNLERDARNFQRRVRRNTDGTLGVSVSAKVLKDCNAEIYGTMDPQVKKLSLGVKLGKFGVPVDRVAKRFVRAGRGVFDEYSVYLGLKIPGNQRRMDDPVGMRHSGIYDYGALGPIRSDNVVDALLLLRRGNVIEEDSFRNDKSVGLNLIMTPVDGLFHERKVTGGLALLADTLIGPFSEVYGEVLDRFIWQFHKSNQRIKGRDLSVKPIWLDEGDFK